MTDMYTERIVERPADEARRLFAGPISGWLPVIVGHDPGTWRAETREGPIRVHLELRVGDVWLLPDDTHRRAVTAQPDRSDMRNLLIAGLTPTVDGHLYLDAGTGQTTRLAFAGQTRRRSRLTTTLERHVIGDPLVRSGIDTLLDVIAKQLATTPLDPPPTGPRHGAIRLPIPRQA